jgi:hypothetical protein
LISSTYIFYHQHFPFFTLSRLSVPI